MRNSQKGQISRVVKRASNHAESMEIRNVFANVGKALEKDPLGKTNATSTARQDARTISQTGLKFGDDLRKVEHQ